MPLGRVRMPQERRVRENPSDTATTPRKRVLANAAIAVVAYIARIHSEKTEMLQREDE